MALSLQAAPFAALEKSFCDDFLQALSNRNTLVVVPSGALRKHLLGLLLRAGSPSLSGVRFVSLNGLAQEIVLDSMREPYTAVDDPLYFTLILQSAIHAAIVKQPHSYRSCKTLLNTIRDMVDGLLTPELLSDFADHATEDRELREQVGNLQALRELQRIYSTFLDFLGRQNLVNVQFSAMSALESTPSWLAAKTFSNLFLYGFYDATPAQFELLELLSRVIHSTDGRVLIYYPFAVSTNSLVEHPAQYSQEFYDRIRSFTESLGGSLRTVDAPEEQNACAVIDRLLFRNTQELQSDHRIEVFNCGSPYDEAWAVAKKILTLVLEEDVRFDQIGVIARSLEPCKTALLNVFRENHIPCNLPEEVPLSCTSSAHFAYLLLQCRLSNLNHSVIFELLCSPLLKDPFKHSGVLRDLLDTLFITNSDDWQRMKPLLLQTKLPEILEMEENDWRVPYFREAAAYLLTLKDNIERIPLKSTIPQYAAILLELINELADSKKLEVAAFGDLELLLERLIDCPVQDSYRLAEFAEIFRDHLAGALTTQASPEQESQVTIGDVMNLRGVSFDYTFIIHLNHDLFPLRFTEDPFLPDHVRRSLRLVTGAGPFPKRAYTLGDQSPDAPDEELLLFSLALRSAKKKLFLSYLRADSDGKRKAASIYVEEVLRLLTGRTSEGNPFVELVPRNLPERFKKPYLPSLNECASLTSLYRPQEVVPQIYCLPADYADGTINFAERLNSMEMETALQLDGFIPEAAEFWKEFSDSHLRYSYSRIKDYVRCPFSFFSDRILRLESSPFAPVEIVHDLTPLVKGRIAESVVKEAVTRLRAGESSIEGAVENAAARVRRKYTPYFPSVLLEHYMNQFGIGAVSLLHFLNDEGYDFHFSETPGRDYDKDGIKLVENASGALFIYGIPDLLLFGRRKLIGELKWGSKATTDTGNAMFKRGEFQFCFYPELERQRRQLLDQVDFRYLRIDAFADYGSPPELEAKLRELGAPSNLDTALRIFGHAPSEQEVAENYEKLRQKGIGILNGEFRIVKDPNDIFSPCTNCRFILICRRTHSATLLRAKKEQDNEERNDL